MVLFLVRVSISNVKYFYLSEGWIVGRVWEFGGLWDEMSRRRKPYIELLNLGMVERGQILWLYEVEEDVLMVEVMPTEAVSNPGPFGTVVLKRLITAEQAIECMRKADGVVKRNNSDQ